MSLEIQLRVTLHTLYDLKNQHGEMFKVYIRDECLPIKVWIGRIFSAAKKNGISLSKKRKRKST